MKEQLKILKKHILTGTSHMIPFIVAGGIHFFSGSHAESGRRSHT